MFLRQAADGGAEAIVNVASRADLYAAMQPGWTGEDYGTADLYVCADCRRRSRTKRVAHAAAKERGARCRNRRAGYRKACAAVEGAEVANVASAITLNTILLSEREDQQCDMATTATHNHSNLCVAGVSLATHFSQHRQTAPIDRRPGVYENV